MVWQDNQVGKFVHEKFLSFRITVNDKEYPKFRKDYGVRGTPSVLFLDSNGEEVDRIVGFDGKKDDFFQTLQDFAAGKNTLPALLSEYENNPEGVDQNFKLAQKYRSRYELNKALPYFEKVLELDPEDESGYKVEATFQVALNQLSSKQNTEPLKAFIADNPAEKYLIDSFVELGYYYVSNKDVDRAVETLEASLEKIPDSARLMTFYAQTIFRNKIESHYDSALTLNEKAVTVDPEQGLDAYFNLIQYYRNIQNQEKLIEIFEEAIRKYEDNVSLKLIYVRSILGMKIESKYDAGIEMTKDTLEKYPEMANMWHMLGQLYDRNGNLEEALNAVNKAVELRPEIKPYQRTLERLESKLQK